MVGRPIRRRKPNRCGLTLLLGLTLLPLACSSNAAPDADIEDDSDPSASDGPDDSETTPPKRDAGGSGTRPSDASADKPKLDAANPRKDGGFSAADAASGTSNDAASGTSNDAAIANDVVTGSDAATESDGGQPPNAGPADYAKRGPHVVLTEKERRQGLPQHERDRPDGVLRIVRGRHHAAWRDGRRRRADQLPG